MTTLFDCVTFCETVLAAAIAGNRSQFDSVLRSIRYHNGTVAWRERNHYFFEWCQHNVDNNTCHWVHLDGAIDINKTVDSQPGLGKRRFAMSVIPSTGFLANSGKLKRGDIVGFVSRRPDLDYFHTGFVAFDKTGTFCFDMHRKADVACLMNGWMSSCRPMRVATSRWCDRRSHMRLP